ncbi:MAG: flagellar motor switch protein FliN [Acidimicrobiales bacterium]
MSTGTEVPTSDVVGLLAETVERGASQLAGGNRLAGPAAAQDEPADLIPGDPQQCAGLALTFADGNVTTIMLTHSLALELCGGIAAEQLQSGLQVMVDELSGGLGQPVMEAIGLTSGDELVHFLSGRSVVLGAGIFENDEVVATIAAADANGAAGTTDAPAPMASAAAPATPEAASAPAPAPAAPAAPAVDPLPPVGAAPAASHATVSDAVLARGLALLADVSLAVTAELGRSHLRVSELLALEPGSVIGLERDAGSPVDLLVNGSLFARAEVIVVDGRYAVRITELVGNGVPT